MDNEDRVSEPMTAEELAELKRLVEVATPGEWGEGCHTGKWSIWGDVASKILADTWRRRIILNFNPNFPPEDDFAFICAARTAVPRLIAEVETLRTRCHQYVERLHSLQARCYQYNDLARSRGEEIERLKMALEASDAGKALLDRLERLEKVAEAARHLIDWNLGVYDHFSDHPDQDSVVSDAEAVREALKALDQDSQDSVIERSK